MGLVSFAEKRKWSRVSQMSWDEVRARLGQEFAKRVDLAFYRTGIGQRAPQLKPHPALQPKFFFGKDEAQQRATLLRTHLPADVDAIVQEANEICRREFRLLGYEKVNLGPEIDWHFAGGDKRGRLAPWFKIDFLDFAAVGDHKLVWELNRHQHLVTLAKAWLLTGNVAYVNELTAQWYSWRKANPYPLGINWASTLEVAFRSLSWLWVRNLLPECQHLPANFQTDILLALQSHGRHIERYLSTYFSPNTHLLGEAVALFFTGMLCPEIAAADRWRKKGWQIILQESQRQVRPDGVYFEQALYYHVYALDFFLHARILASRNGTAVPERFDHVLKKMLNVIQSLAGNGPIEGFGDDDGGRVFNHRRNRVEYMTDPLALGAILYGDKYASASLTEESIWLFGDDALRAFTRPLPASDQASAAFPSGGIYLMSDLDPCAQQLMIDAGPQGTGTSGHGHADALSIRFALDGRRFLIDPGTYHYVSDGNERDWFRGTAAHNTLRVDSVDQAAPEGPFAWSSIPNVTAATWLNGQTFDLFVGSQNGYRRLPEPVLHRRFVFHVKGGLWLVRDVAEGQGKHLLESCWHFAPQVEVTAERGMIVARSFADAKTAGRAGLALLVDPNSGWATEITEGHVSPAYGCKETAPVLRVSSNVALPADCAVLLMPGVDASPVGTFAELGESSCSAVRGYRYQSVEAAELVFFAAGGIPWRCGHWTSDGKFLYCKLQSGRISHVIMVSGTFCEWRGNRLIATPTRAEVFEWINLRGTKRSSSSEAVVLEDLMISDSGVLNSVL
jgi:Heparinase II/III-like protein/Heparinase II/III N-terminus